jgi:hypothetical protein
MSLKHERSLGTDRRHPLPGARRDGDGRYIRDGAEHQVTADDALPTRTSSTHEMQQAGDDDLVLLIVYLNAP